MRTLAVLACLSLLAMPTSACARECMPRVRDGWIRPMPGGAPVRAGYGRIENACPSPITIASATSPAYERVELHGSSSEQGIRRMRAVQLLRIPAATATVLKPGGLHLMLVRPKPGLERAGKVVIEFTLLDGRRLRGDFAVRTPTD